MASVSPVTPVTIFQAARDRVSEEIGSIVACLNNKRTELFEEIASLEREFSDKQKEKQKDITKLNTLISQTEELGQNTLLKVQQKLIQEIQQKIESLQLEEKQKPDYKIEIEWGFEVPSLILNICNSEIIKETTTTTTTDDPWAQDTLLLSDATGSSEDLNTELVIGHNSNSDRDKDSPKGMTYREERRMPSREQRMPYREERRMPSREQRMPYREERDTFVTPYERQYGERESEYRPHSQGSFRNGNQGFRDRDRDGGGFIPRDYHESGCRYPNRNEERYYDVRRDFRPPRRARESGPRGHFAPPKHKRGRNNNNPRDYDISWD